MRGRFFLIAALAAPALSGCGGLALSDKAAPSAPVVAVLAAPAAAPSQTASLSPATPAAPALPQPPAPPELPAIPTGAALGGVLGGPIGAGLTDADRQVAWQAQIAALDSGKPRSWRGAHGVFGSVEPGAETGGGCRAYAQTIYVAGRPNHGQGTACKQPDGVWKMTS